MYTHVKTCPVWNGDTICIRYEQSIRKSAIGEFTQVVAHIISGMFAFSISTITLDTKHNPVNTIQYRAGWLITWKRKRKELEQIYQCFCLKSLHFINYLPLTR